VAVEEALVRRPRGGVVVDAGPFHAGAVALRGRVVEGEQPVPPRVNGAAEAAEEQAAAGVHPVAAQAAEQVVGTAEVVGDVAGAEPGGGRAPAAGEEDALEEGRQEVGLASIDQGG
jgi:hypothetical protein